MSSPHYTHDMMHCQQEQCPNKNKCYRYWLGQNAVVIELDKKWRFEWDDNKTLTVRIYIGDEKICGASVT